MTFKERAQGEPEAIRAWFYPGAQSGEEFVYPKSKALELAKIANEPVLETPTPMADVEALKTAPIEAVNPAGQPVPVAEVVQAPVQIAKVETLPHTASYLPLLFCAGLLSLAAAGLITKHSV